MFEKPFVLFVLLCSIYLTVLYDYLFSDLLPMGDSMFFHFTVFRHIGDTLRHTAGFPEWFPSNGGVRAGFFHINFFMTLPSKIIGYFIYAVFPVSPIIAYKLQHIAGLVITSWGWWLVLQKVTNCKYSSFLGTSMVLMGGLGITLHHEQASATSYLIPWFILSISKIREDTLFLYPALIIFGIGLSTHYPQIQLISMGLFIIITVLFNFDIFKKILGNISRLPKKHLYCLMVLFSLTVLPSFYLYVNSKNLGSIYRGAIETLQPETYEEYSNIIESGGFCYVLPQYLLQFVAPVPAGSSQEIKGILRNRYALYVGKAGFIFATLGVLLCFKRVLPIVILLTLFILISFGASGPINLPKYLFLMHFPFIGTFRQYYHFFPMIIFCLSAIGAIGFSSMVQNLRNKSTLLSGVFIFLVLFLQILDLTVYDQNYIQKYNSKGLGDSPRTINIHTEIPEFFYNKMDEVPALIFQYKNRLRYASSPCAGDALAQPFLTTDVISISDADKELEITREMANLGKNSVISNVTNQEINSFMDRNAKKTSKIPVSGNVTFDGYHLALNVPHDSFLVVPINYDLRLKAYTNDKETKIYRVNSAISGIFVQKGSQEIRFIVPEDFYAFIRWSQMFLYIFVAIFFWIRLKPSGQTRTEGLTQTPS
jgi:hypothetical protein